MSPCTAPPTRRPADSDDGRGASPRARRRLWRAALAILATWLFTHLVWIVGDGLVDEGRVADVGVILGNRVDPDGTPSPWLQARLDRGLSLYRAGRVQRLIVSGGLGVEGHEEADVMKRYLVTRGVPAKRVIADRDGYNTFQTARNTHAIMRARGYESAFVISQYYHVARCKLALRRFGVHEVYGARARLELGPRDLWSVARELAALPTYYLRQDYPPGDTRTDALDGTEPAMTSALASSAADATALVRADRRAVAQLGRS